ncbi:hypothetical protein KKI24_08660 [bacterium]|nr:hypothetical protein [bacterium]
MMEQRVHQKHVANFEFCFNKKELYLSRHAHGGGHPGVFHRLHIWTPACAGVTNYPHDFGTPGTDRDLTSKKQFPKMRFGFFITAGRTLFERPAGGFVFQRCFSCLEKMGNYSPRCTPKVLCFKKRMNPPGAPGCHPWLTRFLKHNTFGAERKSN